MSLSLDLALEERAKQIRSIPERISDLGQIMAIHPDKCILRIVPAELGRLVHWNDGTVTAVRSA